MYAAFVKLEGRACLVVGGGAVAERKTLALLAAGAAVRVIAPTVTPRLAELAAAGRLELAARAYQPPEAGDYFLSVGATDDPATNARMSADAQARERLVNVADQPELSNFYVPAVLTRGELQIAVSTSGGCPALACKLRDDLAAWLPPAYGPLLEALAAFRRRLAATEPDPVRRRQALEQVLASPALVAYLAGDEAALNEVLH